MQKNYIFQKDLKEDLFEKIAAEEKIGCVIDGESKKDESVILLGLNGEAFSVKCERWQNGDGGSIGAPSLRKQIELFFLRSGGGIVQLFYLVTEEGYWMPETKKMVVVSGRELAAMLRGEWEEAKRAEEALLASQEAAAERVAAIMGGAAALAEPERLALGWYGPSWRLRDGGASIDYSDPKRSEIIKEKGEPNWASLNGMLVPLKDNSRLSFEKKQELIALVERARKYNFLAKNSPSETEEKAFYEKKAQVLKRICKNFEYNVEFPHYIQSDNYYYDLYEIAIVVNGRRIFCCHLPAEVVDGWFKKEAIESNSIASRDDWETNRRRREELLKELDEAL
jgi:hypothetical protein